MDSTGISVVDEDSELVLLNHLLVKGQQVLLAGRVVEADPVVAAAPCVSCGLIQEPSPSYLK